jgi:hypothetical protein
MQHSRQVKHSLLALVLCVDVRWIVLVEKHPDDNPEESAYLWHSIASLSSIVAGARMFSSSLSSANDEISRRAFYGRLHCLVQVSRFAAVLPAMSLSHAPTE